MTRLLLVCVLCVPGVAAAQIAGGTYEIDRCTDPLSDARMSINGPELLFHESACQITGVEGIRGIESAVLYDLRCTGEGENWTNRVLMMPTRNGEVIILRDGFVTRYVYCGAN